MGDFAMPSLGADMEAGTIVQWLVKPGDEVHRGDIVAVIDTEKSTIEVEIFEDGVIEQLLVDEGTLVPVGTLLAHIGSGAATTTTPTASPVPPHAGSTLQDVVAPPTPPPTSVPTLMPEPPSEPAEPAGPTEPAGPSGRAGPARVAAIVPATADISTRHAPVISPVVRHLAERLGVELATLSGTGLGGSVTREDVEEAAGRRGQSKNDPAQTPGRSGTPSSPYARKVAAELGVDITTVRGSGPGGSVVEDDVRRVAAAAEVIEPATSPMETASSAPEPSSSAEEDTAAALLNRQAAMRRAIGALMARSKREIPHYYLSTTIDLTVATNWLEQANLERPLTGRLIMSALLLKATALAARTVPEVNGFMVDNAFAPSEDVHIGVAVSLRTGGVIAPALHHADRLTLDDLMAGLKDVVGRARTGVLRSSEMNDPTITVTNLGDQGVEAVFGVIYPPQVALVGFGKVLERPWASGGMLGVHPCVTATLSADHRVSDGHRGARFLAEIDRLLQEPQKL